MQVSTAAVCSWLPWQQHSWMATYHQALLHPLSDFLVLSALSSVLFYGVCVICDVCVVYVSVVFLYMCDVYRVLRCVCV